MQMAFSFFMIFQLLIMVFLGFLMGYLVGSNHGQKEATKTWKEAFEKK